MKNKPTTKINVGPSESMSKSKKNTIDPQVMINNYGADAVRLFILSDSPPEKDIQWSDQGMISAYKFIQKFWILHKKIVNNKFNNNEKIKDIENINTFTNNIINRITKNLENFQFNVIVANLHETYNFLIKSIEDQNNKEEFFNNYSKILKAISPIIPHIAEECLEEINVNKKNEWPEIDKKFLKKNIFNIVVQINGKKRELLTMDKEINEKELLKQLKRNEKNKKFLDNNKIKKSIYIKNKLINLII